ncbi:carboxylesterase 1-like [Bidens hawaiensis]|uniref:carboxylesterase 1-like n=1 Tax=Bidens hawaiensis TaxID=980011 RepID=UPI00404978E9
MSDETLPAEENQPFVVLNADGSYTRLISFSCSHPTADPDPDTPALSKDVTINDINKTGCRIHIPKETLTAQRKLPLIGSWKAVLRCIHEGVEALHWIKSTQDPWLTQFADFSNCYLMGSSAGANLVYHAALRVSQHLADLEPLNIKGLVLHNLFIGGVERTESEIRLASTGFLLTLSLSDSMWNLALPVGATRDHEYFNLMMSRSLDNMGRIKEVGWPVMMAIRYGDLMMDRQIEFTKSLELKGVECTCFFSEGDHGIEYFDKSKAIELIESLSSFYATLNLLKFF